MPHIIALATFPPPRTGQSVVTEVVCAALEREAEVVRVDASRGMDTWRSGLRGALQRSRAWLGTVRDLRNALKDDADLVYLTPAASRMGTVRDVVALLVIGRGRPVCRVGYGTGRRVVAHVHAGSMGAHLSQSGMARWVARRCDRILVPSEYAAVSIREGVPAADVRVVYNPITPKLRFGREEVEAKWDRGHPEYPSILFLANMIPGKGYGDLISAVSRLETPVRVVLAGEWSAPEEHAQFERRIEALDLAEDVQITGALPIEDVRAALLNATILVHPSRMRHESAPLVLVEGMAAGCAVVAYDHAGSKELIGDAGLLVAPGNIDGLVAAISQVLEDPLSWGKRARMRYEQVFSPDSLESTVVGEILSVLSRP